MTARVALALCFSAGAVARADVPAHTPRTGEGTIAILGGLRYVPQASTLGFTDRKLFPGGVAGQFGYQYDDAISVAIDISYLADRYDFADFSRLHVGTTDVSFLLMWTPRPWGRLAPYLGGGAAYSFSSFLTTGQPVAIHEGSTQGAVLAGGLRLALWGGFGLQLEDRFVFAQADSTTHGSLDVGGNLLSLGLWVAMDADESHH